MKRILTALDASPRAPLVLAAAARLAELTGAKLVLYRALMVPPEMPRQVFSMTDGRLEDYLRQNARTDLERTASEISPALIETIATSFATSWDGICQAGREHDADLIILGSHGFGGLDRLLGTTAAKVVNHADRNVMVVRTPL
jgi:nucleotide-binding universal stress UspA family protein